MTMSASPLQVVANARLLFFQPQHPGSREPVIVARHVLDVFIAQQRLISNNTNGPGVDTGDILCEGYICRAAVLDAKRPYAWDFLDASQPWQGIGVRGIYQPPDLTDPDTGITTTPPATTCFAPCDGLCWLGDLSGLQSPGLLPPQPRAELLGLSLLLVGQAYGSGGIGALVQPQLGEKVVLALKPNRVLVISPGDTLSVIAERYGTTVQTLRKENPELATYETIVTVVGDTLNLLAGRHGTTVDTLRNLNPQLLRADGHLVLEGDTLAVLAELYDTTRPTLREYNLPDLDRYPGAEQLPLGLVVNVPAIRPSSELDPGQDLVVPAIRPSTLLPAGGWIRLPKLRGVSVTDDLWDVDPTLEQPTPDPDPDPTSPLVGFSSINL
ncbi:LysM peptidoglycan-binding domain-containing protein [Synechococcus sp. CS-602]|uniref:LysM peptidoglycan-binding domain-containing protein n=1 Tax=Synechococcaceae TaxID=1890426 RepID=UPI0011A2B164|nr:MULTISPECIES: LysM domain-containing protein [Synechococcaceae]MCT0204207.1 LysM peptidoglycan-binding domain-containing protein [Synechococcus sp. CS-602]MCT4364384.1 LysM peptidoglycan-binding domain-containing protein [Candidatus Regnicoccus frigidus MAG-AL1]MCT4366907.1 LysM peptidoglycan-binding domain-containing protein [Candidatus Regnicoccus frigidus MAG-AL2]TWB86857.1 LysM domain-containing protein [Synechococcus sp. Ace-Pa]